jgi:hypothetical protein
VACQGTENAARPVFSGMPTPLWRDLMEALFLLPHLLLKNTFSFMGKFAILIDGLKFRAFFAGFVL